MRGARARHSPSVRLQTKVCRVCSLHPPQSASITSPPTVFRRRVFFFEEPILNTLNVEYRKVEALIPYARNPRTHSDAQIAKIAASIVEYGWTNPVLVDGDNGIIAGHGRLAAARKLGLDQVPVIELAHLSPTQKRAYVISDNRLALDAGWNEEMLALEMAELSEADPSYTTMAWPLCRS